MTREQAFELLNTFCEQAHFTSHIYDVYHGEKLQQVHFIIYDSDKAGAKFVAQLSFDDMFTDEPYIVELWIRNKLYQLFDFDACSDLIKTIDYENGR